MAAGIVLSVQKEQPVAQTPITTSTEKAKPVAVDQQTKEETYKANQVWKGTKRPKLLSPAEAEAEATIQRKQKFEELLNRTPEELAKGLYPHAVTLQNVTGSSGALLHSVDLHREKDGYTINTIGETPDGKGAMFSSYKYSTSGNFIEITDCYFYGKDESPRKIVHSMGKQARADGDQIISQLKRPQ